ncbi:hypothetical protein K432DRAFT_377252 [Lepidopterella palustris CBS 459.81]|uniref:NIMA interactive protein n=1 Tax=Lepidopterella palustris CBS 459.81 TaxID=1314670 RepID=A0A8E2EKX1_9PEZI|nr:hypothetical protein K432DRAFT_377252 [Lepidopterella palustris CBS 459.81]
MDAFNLKTASTYINNLLLARGLLRDGKAIEFARPSKAEGGKEVTMAQIINLVHDLILRRDRDQEQRESIAQTLRTLRTESASQTVALERQKTRAEDLTRQLSLSQSQERAARAALRTAEASARSLREEMLRLKTTVQQVRTSCANDVRKRDVQIQRLKTHLTAQQRGNKTGLVGASISITPGASGISGSGFAGREEEVPGVDDPEYSLRLETTEFLTQLSQSLSDENDNLIGLVRSTLGTLRELQGMPEAQRGVEMGQLETVVEEDMGEGMVNALPTSYEALATDMDTVLENLKTLLTNPNFVPIEEVELREEEIVRLRAGWEKMEARWKEAVAMMEGWRKRMQNGGDTINLEELKMGLGLGQNVSVADGDEGEMDSDVVDDIEDGMEGEDSRLEDPPSPEKGDEAGLASNSDIFNIQLQPEQSALRESNGNIKSPRKVAFAPSINNTPSMGADENASEVDLVGDTPSGKTATSIEKSQLSRSRAKLQESRIPRQAQKRRSSPLPHPEERLPKLTVQDKLNVAQAEAEAAALADGLVAVKSGVEARTEVDDEQQQHRRRSSPRKTRIGGRPKRRKSTLTPEELQNLLGFE